MTADPPAQVAAALGLLRPVADEVLVAVDTRVDPAELSAYAGVADRVVRFDFREPVDRPRTWLHGQCSGEWTFYLDGDEVPSAALVDTLDRILDADDVVHYWLPRRWLFGNPTTWIAELPWWPDFQLRLARRGSALGFRGGLHGGLAPLFPARHLEAPIYHLDLLVTSESQRAAKAAAYSAYQTSPAAYGGGPLNDTLYLPERHVIGELRPVPAEDRSTIESLLAARSPRQAHGDVGLVDALLVPPAAIDVLSPGRELPASAYQARLSLFDDQDRRFAPGETRPVYVRVRNLGSVWWPWGPEQVPALRLTYRWSSPADEPVATQTILTPLTARVGPGEEQLLPMFVAAPSAPGRYRLQLELIHEGVRTFPPPLVIDVAVAERPVKA